MRPSIDPGDENFPDPAPEQFAHRMDASIPAVEIAHYADPRRVRRPDREIHSPVTADLAELRAKFLVELLVISLREKMDVHLAHDRPVTVGIPQQLLGAIESAEINEKREIQQLVRHGRLVKSFDVQTLGRKNPRPIIRRHDLNLLRLGPKDANHKIVASPVRAEDAEGIGVRAVQDRGDVVGVERMDGK